MFLLYNGNESGSSEARLVSRVHPVQWELLRRNVTRILRTLLHDVDAATSLESMPFELWEGTNGFGDQFELLYMKVPVETYQEIELGADSYPAKARYETIAQAMEQAGNRIRFISMDANTDDLRTISTPDANSTASPPFGDTDDRKFARLAIEEARKSVPEDDRVHPRVGVVVVKDGRILASAHRGEIPQCHAEYIALEKKLTDVSLLGATVYTTLEPCTARKHPKVPCAIRLTERKVTRVVIGVLDPDDRISGRGQRTLRKAGIATELFPHDLMAEVEELNRDFVRDRESRENDRRNENQQAPPDLYNFNGNPGPIPLSGMTHSVQGPWMDVRGLVTIVNPTQSPMKIALRRLVLGGKECAVHSMFFMPKSNPMQRFERISLMGNSKEDYEVHVMFPDTDYPTPPPREGELWVSCDNRPEEFPVKVRCP